MAGVSIKQLSKSYGTVQVLRQVSFEAREGEFVALVGPSGCGKSTMLRCVAGLEGFEGGDISIAGRIVNNIEPKERDVAMVFQNYALYPHMTVRQNMAFSLKLRKAPKDEINARVQEAAAILGLTDYLARYPRQLSGGQRQRVAMGRAIVRKPAVFLFDEPLSNLDAALRVQMRAEIRGLHKRLGVTSIYVTHDQIEAMTMADKIVVMRNGIVEQVGPPLELYDTPKNIFVATFIGSPAMNILSGKLSKGVFTTPDRQAIRMDQSHSSLVAKIELAAKLGVRPEHISVATDTKHSGLNAVVESVETTGAATYVCCQIAEMRINAVISDRLDLSIGQKVKLVINMDRTHLFDENSGVRFG
jgi:multiple sugar transport system ATP-binding protein